MTLPTDSQADGGFANGHLACTDLDHVEEIKEEDIDPDPSADQWDVPQGSQGANRIVLSNTLLTALKQINSRRATAGKAPLRADMNLMAAAQKQALQCKNTNSTTSTGADGSVAADRIKRAGFNTTQSELVASGATPVAVVTTLAGVPANLTAMNNTALLALGVGYATARNGTRFWVFDFGKP